MEITPHLLTPQLLLSFIKHIIDHEIEACAQIRHIAAEGCIGIDGNLKAVQIHTKIWGEKFLDIRIFIALHLLRRETLLTEVLESLIAHSVHRLWGMREDRLPCLIV